MTTAEWLEKCRRNRRNLLRLIGDWHPGSRPHIRNETAQFAPQAACNTVCNKILQEGRWLMPGQQFLAALDRSDVGTAHRILSETWFGVPESTACWSLLGFADAVDLLDDPPDDWEDEADDV